MLFFLTSQQLWISGAIIIGGGTLLAMLGPALVRRGAGGMIAAAKVAHADPDGYTILLHQDALAAGMTLYPERTFDAEKDFAPIGLVNTTTNTLAGRPSLPDPGYWDACQA